MPRPDPWVSRWQPGHDNPGVKAIFAFLCDWYNALEDGRAALRLPDLYYFRPKGKPAWTEADLSRIIAALDEEFQKEVNSRSSFVWCDAGPEFSRLQLPQRLALVQGLERIVAQAEGDLKDHRLSEPCVAWVNGAQGGAGVHLDHWNGRYVVKGKGIEAETLEQAKALALEALGGPPPPYEPCYGC